MQRFVVLAVAVLFAASVVAMGMGYTGFHPGSDGETHVSQTAGMAAQDMVGDHGETAPDDGTFHMTCAVAGHSCSGFIAPELGVWPLRSTDERGWTAIAQRTVASLSPEATTPPPRV